MVQIVQGLGASAFFTVASKPEVQTLSTEFDIDVKSIAVNASTSTALASSKEWLGVPGAEGFDIIFNSLAALIFPLSAMLYPPSVCIIRRPANPSDSLRMPPLKDRRHRV